MTPIGHHVVVALDAADGGKPLFEHHLQFAAVDVEVVDANRDGILDLYLIQTDRSKGTYCGPKFNPQDWWKHGPQPPADFVPPIDTAQDLLLVATKDASRFTPVRLEHALPGCGGLVTPSIARRSSHRETSLNPDTTYYLNGEVPWPRLPDRHQVITTL